MPDLRVVPCPAEHRESTRRSLVSELARIGKELASLDGAAQSIERPHEEGLIYLAAECVQNACRRLREGT